MSRAQNRGRDEPIEYVAGGGLLHRRLFLTRSLALAGAAGAGAAALTASPALAQDRIADNGFPDWMTRQGGGRSSYGAPSPYEDAMKKTLSPDIPVAPGVGVSLTPLERMNGIITPNGLHFERHHSSVPDIDPARHKLILHGLVRQPLVYDIEALLRYPMTSRLYFLECSGNSGRAFLPRPLQGTCGSLHGLLSCAEWTGVPLSVLLDEAGLDPRGKWVIAEGAEAASMVRSVPMAKALDDVIVALYQNGERLRPGQGYPMRLFVPGCEGNISVKWLHRLKVTEGPAESRAETAEYTDLLPDGKALQFTLPMGVKSVITRPSPGLVLGAPGFYELAGLAWSGHGRVARVEVSADGGKSWAEAALDDLRLPRCLTRFRIPWEWKAAPAVLQSRATDDKGNVQPARTALMKQYSPGNKYHYNAIIGWSIAASGEMSHVFS
jgi:sulfane dehydrogenase subunit SoxC